MGAAAFGLIAALGFAAGSVVTKHLVGRFDFDQLIGPAFALNAMWLIPLVPFVEWEWSGAIVLLHAISVISISLTSRLWALPRSSPGRDGVRPPGSWLARSW